MEDTKEPEKQVKEQEKKANIVRITLTEKQVDIIGSLRSEKNKVQEEFNRLNKQESNLIVFALEFKEINRKEVDSVSISEDGSALVVQLKAEVPK